MMIITKPLIEYSNLTKDYTLHVYPASGTEGDDADPEDVTYTEIMTWMYDSSKDWETRAIEYIDMLDPFDDINKSLKDRPKLKIFTFNKYEDLRVYRKEDEKFKEFPCKFHWFYAKFSKYDIRRVKSLSIELSFEKTGIKRNFIYTFDEFLDFFNQDENLWEDAIIDSMKEFYKNTDNLANYFRILTIDTSVWTK